MRDVYLKFESAQEIARLCIAQESRNVLLLDIGIIGVSYQLLVEFIHVAHVFKEWTAISSVTISPSTRLGKWQVQVTY